MSSAAAAPREPRTRPARLIPLLAAASVAGGFLFFAGASLRAGFSHDDLMNLHGAWRHSIWRHLGDLVLFFRPSPAFRPLGALWYRLMLEVFGFNPAPYRAAVYVILAADLWLAYALLRRLSRSRAIAAAAVVLCAYHGRFEQFYINTGTVYDPLCLFFYLAAFLYYLRIRGAGVEPPGWGRTAVWSGLYILSLNAKEMAVSLPAAILAFELLTRAPKPRDILRWTFREGRVVAAGAAITLLFVFGRVLAADGIAAINLYRPSLRAGVYLDGAYYYAGQALYEPAWLTPSRFYLGAALALAAVVFRGSVPARFGLAWAAVGFLPIAFIAKRGLDAALIPLLGAALFLATAVATAVRRLPGRLRFGGSALLCAALLTAHLRYGRIDFSAVNLDSPRMISVYRDFGKLRFPANTRMLVLRDPFPEQDWASAFLLYLATRDRSLSINRLDRLHPGEVSFVEFQEAVSWEGGHVVECDPSAFRKLYPAHPPAAVCRQP